MIFFYVSPGSIKIREEITEMFLKLFCLDKKKGEKRIWDFKKFEKVLFWNNLEGINILCFSATKKSLLLITSWMLRFAEHSPRLSDFFWKRE
jgi:hypothetical protein